MSQQWVPYFVSAGPHILSAIREQIRVRLATVTAAVNLRVLDWDGLGQDLGGNSLTIGVPSSTFARQDPLGEDVALGKWGWEHRWPITLTVARTTDRASTLVVDDLQQDIAEAIFSDPTLGGTCLAAALVSSDPDDTDPDATMAAHILVWELVTVVHRNA